VFNFKNGDKEMTQTIRKKISSTKCEIYYHSNNSKAKPKDCRYCYDVNIRLIVDTIENYFDKPIEEITVEDVLQENNTTQLFLEIAKGNKYEICDDNGNSYYYAKNLKEAQDCFKFFNC
jgi:hypothetical protein